MGVLAACVCVCVCMCVIAVYVCALACVSVLAVDCVLAVGRGRVARTEYSKPPAPRRNHPFALKHLQHAGEGRALISRL